MLGALRRKFLLAAAAAIACALFVVCAAVNLGFSALTTARADAVIQTLYDNEGEFPADIEQAPSPTFSFRLSAETPFETRYLIARTDAHSSVTNVDTAHIASFDRASAAELVREIIEGKDDRGYCGIYRYATFPEDDGGATIVVLDCFLYQQSASMLLFITVAVAALCVLASMAILIPLSRRIVRPFAENLARQQRFVTDASHEFKTPLAIIAANTDLIAAEQGESRWTNSTKSQVARMHALVESMVELARANERSSSADAGRANIAAIASLATEEFTPLAQARGVRLLARTDKQAWAAVSPETARRLCAILLDNAAKYCDEGGQAIVSVRCHRKIVELCVENPCANLREEDVSRMFDRFWRADPSRARTTGGHGIGLATARALAERHGGRADASLNGGSVRITVTLPTA